MRRARLPFSRASVSESPKILAAPIGRLLRRWRIQPQVLTVGSTGIWKPREKAALKRSLENLALKVRTFSDAELAWHANFERRGEGVLVIAGTGAIALAKARGGRAARAGGLGPILGDEGSAFWIGRTWLKTRPETEILRFVHRPDVVRYVARLAKKAPREIFSQAALHLVKMAETAASKAGLRGSVPITCHGGLFRDSRLASAFDVRLSRSRLRWNKLPSEAAPEVAVAGSALLRTEFIVE